MEFNERFRGYLPVVVDIETGGFDAERNPLLEIACATLAWTEDKLHVEDIHSWEIKPYPGSIIDPASLKITGIDPERDAAEERDALVAFFKLVRTAIKSHSCNRAIIVAHNASFDQGFLNRACDRQNIKRNPFHPFSALDTATLAAVAYGHTVLSEACRRAGITFDDKAAHRADYDVAATAELFCRIVNRFEALSKS